MSEALEQVVDRAAKDANFRNLLLTNPEAALKGYAVTADERQLLDGLTEETFDEFSGSLGDRTTKGMWPGTG